MSTKIVAALAVGFCAAGALGGETEDFDRYLDQFTHIDRLRFDADYQATKISPDGEGPGRLSAAGPYHYAFDGGKFVVESQVVGDDPSHAFMNLIGVYAFTGEQYLVYDAQSDAHESFKDAPSGVIFTVASNPMLMPLAFLRCDLGIGVLLGLEHFNSEEQQSEIGKNIASRTPSRDKDGHQYLEIMLDPEREVRDLGGGVYRVYLSDPGEYDAGFALPERIEYWSRGHIVATIGIPGYEPVRVGQRTLYLPSRVRATLRIDGGEGSEPTRIEIGATITGYSDGKLPPSAFRPDLAGREILVKPDGTILWEGKASQCGKAGG